MGATPGRTFFVESYVPMLDESTALALSSRLRGAIDELRREGLPLRWLQSFALAEEETYVWLVAAPDAEYVGLVNERAGTTCDHVVEMSPGEVEDL